MKAKNPSRTDRWQEACDAALTALKNLREIQSEYEEWRDNLPVNFQTSTGSVLLLRLRLSDVCDLDIESAIDTMNEARDIDLPD